MLEFAGRISILCFAASYGVGVANEICRLVWPRLASWPTTVAAAAGFFAQGLFLLFRGTEQGRLPIASPFDAALVVAWLLVAVYLYYTVRNRTLSLGLFLLPVSLALVLFATFTLDRRPSDNALSGKILGAAHGILLLLGTGMVVWGMLAAGMYLLKTRQLRTGAMFGRLKLPSLERLDRSNSLAIVVAWPLLTLGIGLGFALRGLAWSDPKVLATVGAWAFLTFLAHYRYQPEHHGKRMAWMTLAAGTFVLVAVLGDPLFGTSHQIVRGAP
ncbi:MAG TPA: cytochrome c biogenesis protein CcsA [Planctomycetia bacterium]|jgi:ABC-type transport system involved in cytochrome c biogenesis permease subunit|nr:cytochrome c biogenesis protein CcsA [Planctomycetia bacterium]